MIAPIDPANSWIVCFDVCKEIIRDYLESKPVIFDENVFFAGMSTVEEVEIIDDCSF